MQLAVYHLQPCMEKLIRVCQVWIADFGVINNLFKMASNGEVIYMKEFRIVEMNIFEVWVITVRSHLKGRNYAQSTKILYSEYNLAD